MRSIVAVAVIATALGAGAAYAQEFKNEATPLFDNCGDPSYEKAKTEGITVGISPSPPFTSINPDTQKAEGLEVEIDEAALHWAGINNIKYEVMPFGQLISALQAKRIDMVAAIHVTPDRLKVISFTGPSYWYGPGLLVKAGNPEGIKSYDDLKGKQIGAIAGSAADEYLRTVGAEVVPFQTDAEEFSAVSTGRSAAILEDDTKIAMFLAANKDSAHGDAAGHQGAGRAHLQIRLRLRARWRFARKTARCAPRSRRALPKSAATATSPRS